MGVGFKCVRVCVCVCVCVCYTSVEKQIRHKDIETAPRTEIREENRAVDRESKGERD